MKNTVLTQRRAVVAGAVATGIGLSFGAGIAVGSDSPDAPGVRSPPTVPEPAG